jgi:aryl-alcohol dehydrogenase-like predicted oxidoreductase
MDVNNLPACFEQKKDFFEKYQTFVERKKVSRLQAALMFINSIKEIDQVIVGVCSVTQLKEILVQRDCTFFDNADCERFALYDENIINPSNWM